MWLGIPNSGRHDTSNHYRHAGTTSAWFLGEVVAEVEERGPQQSGEVVTFSFRQSRQDLGFRRHVSNDHVLDHVEALLGQADDHLASITARRSGDQAALLESIDSIRDRARRHHRLTHQVAGVSSYGSPERGVREHVVHPILEIESGKVLAESAIDQPRQETRPITSIGELSMSGRSLPLATIRRPRHVSLMPWRHSISISLDIHYLNIKIVNVKDTRNSNVLSQVRPCWLRSRGEPPM